MRALVFVFALALFVPAARAATLDLVPDLQPAFDPGGGDGVGNRPAYVGTATVVDLAILGAWLGLNQLNDARVETVLGTLPLAGVAMVLAQHALGSAFGVRVNWPSAVLGTVIGIAAGAAVTFVGIALFEDPNDSFSRTMDKALFAFGTGLLVTAIGAPVVASTDWARGDVAGGGGDAPEARPLGTAKVAPSARVLPLAAMRF